MVWMIVIAIILVTIVIFVLTRDGVETKDTTRYIFNGQLKIAELPQIDIEDVSFRTYNPSIANVNGDMLIVQRVSNYTGCKQVRSAVQPRKIQSYISMLFNNHVYHVETDPIGSKDCAKGYEDPRPIVSPDKQDLLLFCAARGHQNCLQSMYMLRFPLSKLYEDFRETPQSKSLERSTSNIKYLTPTETLPLQTMISTKRHEKNWMPFVSQDKLLLVYSVNPHIILECNLTTGTCDVIAKTTNSTLGKSLRGGSQVMFLAGNDNRPDLFVGAIHERRGGQAYVTRFYAFATEWPYQILKMSDEFVFDDNEDETLTSIQFASGLAIIHDHRGQMEVHVTYGEHDCRSKFCKIQGKEFLKALRDVDQTHLDVIAQKEFYSSPTDFDAFYN